MPAAAQSGLINVGPRTNVLRWQWKHHESLTGVVSPAMRKALGS